MTAPTVLAGTVTLDGTGATLLDLHGHVLARLEPETVESALPAVVRLHFGAAVLRSRGVCVFSVLVAAPVECVEVAL